jgi:hypothetical protein
MKNIKWVGLVTVLSFPLLSGYGQTPEAAAPGAPGQAQAAAPVNLSPAATEVVRLAGSGVGDDVVLAYIQNSQAPFSLSADAVLYLKDIGLSPQVTSAMLSHDGTLRNQSQQYAPAAPAAPVQAAPPGNAPLTYQWQSPAGPAPGMPAPVTAPPAYVTSAPADVSYFYNDLSPYGTWVSLEGYGWCWQPRTVVISHGWRPYCDGGHWVYTDAGWFWQSDYLWGWAPFHYGRWYQHPSCGWVWTPDRVWGPAWVTWRVAGDTCGWAPLPPRADFDLRLGWRFNGVSVGASFDFGLGIGAFAFVGFGDFCSHDLGHHCLPPARVSTIYRQTTVINNYEVHNNTIVHRGIPIERVTAASRVPVPRATVRDLPAGSARMPSRTAAVVYRSQLQAPTRPVNMVAQKVDAGHPVIQHAPVAPVRTQQTSTFSRGGSAPVSSPRGPGGAQPSSTPQYQQTPRASQPAPTPGRPASSSQYQSTPRASQSAPMTAAPAVSSRSNIAKPASASQYQSTSTSYQPVPTVPSGPATPRAPDNWKQGTQSAPGYRSNAGLPALNNSRSAAQSAPAASPTSSQGMASHVYYPKGYHQAAEVKSLPPSDQHPSASPTSSGRSSGSKSGKNQ